MEAKAFNCEDHKAAAIAKQSIRLMHPTFYDMPLNTAHLQHLVSILPRIRKLEKPSERMIVEYLNRVETIMLMTEVTWFPRNTEIQDCVLLWFFELNNPAVITQVVVNGIGFNKFHEIKLEV